VRKALVSAILLLVLSFVLGATVFREQVANAARAAGALNVFVGNDDAHPVPVHEQGTAAVHVDNFPPSQAVTVAIPATAFNATRDFPSAGFLNFGETGVKAPAGSRLAINSLVLTSTGAAATTLTLQAEGRDSDGSCLALGAERQKLLTLAAPADDTAAVSLPQPFVDEPAGPQGSCLGFEWSGGPGSVSVVGFTK
jgi:hypothetical protein